MDKFLKPIPPSTEKSPVDSLQRSAKRKYDANYIAFGFTEVYEKGEPRPKCVLCGLVLSNESLRPSKLKNHLQRVHDQHAAKSKEFFQLKLQANDNKT